MLHNNIELVPRNHVRCTEIERKSLLIPMTNTPTALIKQDDDGHFAEEESIAGSADESYTDDDPLLDTKFNINLAEDVLAQSSNHSYYAPSSETFVIIFLLASSLVKS